MTEPLTATEVRVLGCLMEKEATTPDAYPLTLNALRTACNQSSNRDPVVSYEDHTVQNALDSLRARSLIRIVYSTANRATKYRHVLHEALDLEPAERAVLTVLLLRGPQTVGEMRTRTGPPPRLRLPRRGRGGRRPLGEPRRAARPPPPPGPRPEGRTGGASPGR